MGGSLGTSTTESSGPRRGPPPPAALAVPSLGRASGLPQGRCWLGAAVHQAAWPSLFTSSWTRQEHQYPHFMKKGSEAQRLDHPKVIEPMGGEA